MIHIIIGMFSSEVQQSISRQGQTVHVHLMVVSWKLACTGKCQEPQVTGRTFKCSVRQRWALSDLEVNWVDCCI